MSILYPIYTPEKHICLGELVEIDGKFPIRVKKPDNIRSFGIEIPFQQIVCRYLRRSFPILLFGRNIE